MKQQQFATRLKSEKLIKEIVDIWREGDQKENLEGIEQDPIFALLVTALAYRTDEIEGEIESLKEGVLRELSRRLIPYKQCRAIPAATVVSTSIVGSIGERAIGAGSTFTLSGSSHRFVPLLDTLIVNGSVDLVQRIDGRRWRVKVATKEPLSRLKGLSFCLDTKPFRDLSVSIDGVELPLVKPWDYANLPLSNIFNVESQLYNYEEIFTPTNRWFDIFAQLDVQLFYIGYLGERDLSLSEREYLDFVFEFKGIDENFEFTQKDIKLNVFPLINVEESWVDLSSDNPIVRLKSADDNSVRSNFLSILPPSEGSNDYLQRVSIREVGADRFTEATLYRLIRGLVNKLSSDYYAFQEVASLRDGVKIEQLYRSLLSISEDLLDTDRHDSLGCYITLNRGLAMSDDEGSFRVRYITTAAEQVNPLLSISSQFIPEKSLSLSLSTAISKPMLGVAPIVDEMARRQVAKYNVVTQDRLVTPADVKAFCSKELSVRYGIGGELIKSIMVAPRLYVDNRITQYVMEVKIHIEQTLYVKRIVTNVEAIEHLLSQMIAVRSSGQYVFDVKLFLESN